MTQSHYLRLSYLLLVLMATGCDREEAVRSYSDRKSTEVAMPISQPGGGMGMPAGGTPTPSEAPGRGFDWKLPQGWSEDPQPRQMRLATAYTTADTDTRAELIVSRLGAQFGDLLGNLNRWRGQVDLPPLAALEAGQPLKLPAGNATLYEMQGEKRSQLVVLLPQAQSNWFFKLIGPRDEVAKQKDAFLSLLQSISLK